MKNELKEITDFTVTELLDNDIILPSQYFKCFNKYAKTIEINIDDEFFEKELNEFILEEFSSINTYVNDAIRTIDNVSDITLKVQNAIKNNDTIQISKLYDNIKDLQLQLEDITNTVYTDHLTKVNNKKWIYHKFLNNDSNFKNDTIIILIDVHDYKYISKTYNKLISNNLLIFISKYLNNHLKEEKIDFNIARFLSNKFIVSVNNEKTDNLQSLINNVNNILQNKTLKTKSGVMIKPSFKYSIKEVKKDESFHDSLNTLSKDIETSNKR